MHATTSFIRSSSKTLMKSPWSVIGLCSCSGKESTANSGTVLPPSSRLGASTSYTMRWTSCGIGWKPDGQLPSASVNAMCVRWLALSMLRPSQQLWKANERTTSLPSGHSGYLSFSCRSSNPVQLQEALALAGPLTKDLASPVMMRSSRGIAVTSAFGLPTKVSVTSFGVTISPTLPSMPPPGDWASCSSVPFCRRSTGQ
ncbi:hypothetical protein GA0115245_12038 [Streptomyces sp. di188]|nr:hypothetical protein GA0115238_10567 [Streptomyces sp. di50b]SCE07521.1 hypothetical protein GA0115245_12038 [Streptomyces sp. di188]